MFGQVQSGWHAQPDDEAGTTEGTTGAKPVSGAGGGTIGDWPHKSPLGRGGGGVTFFPSFTTLFAFHHDAIDSPRDGLTYSFPSLGGPLPTVMTAPNRRPLP